MADASRLDFKWVLSIALALLSLALPFLLAELKEPPSKSFGYSVWSFEGVMGGISDPLLEPVKIVYQDKEIDTLSFVRVRLTNTGDVPIRKSDFDEPIHVFVSESAVLLEAGIASAPDGARPALTQKGNRVLLEPSLFNPGDSVDLKLLIAGLVNDVGVSARIVGIRRLARIRDSFRPPEYTRSGELVLGLALVFLYGYFFMSGWNKMGRLAWRREPFGNLLLFAAAISNGFGGALITTRSISWNDRQMEWAAFMVGGVVAAVLGAGAALVLGRNRDGRQADQLDNRPIAPADKKNDAADTAVDQ